MSSSQSRRSPLIDARPSLSRLSGGVAPVEGAHKSSSSSSSGSAPASGKVLGRARCRALVINALLSLPLLLAVLLPALLWGPGAWAGRPSRPAAPLSLAGHLEVVKRSRHLFVNKTLLVSTVVREPFVAYSGPEPPANATGRHWPPHGRLHNYSGLAVDMLRRLQAMLGFRVRVLRPRQAQFGVLGPDNRWTGLTGALAYRQADVGLTALTVTLGRQAVIDFTRPFYVETVTILMAIPAEVRNYSAIFEPFSGTVWALLSCCLVLLVGLITLMTKLEDDERHLEEEASGAHRRPHAPSRGSASVSLPGSPFGDTWLERFYYATTCVFNILLIRDIKQPPRQTPIRVLVCVWWLASIVLVNVYLGVLFGQLVVARRPASVESLDELAGQRDRHTWAVTRGSSVWDQFVHAPPDSVLGQLAPRMRVVDDADEGIRRALHSGWAYIRERSLLEFKVAQEHERLRACKLRLARRDGLASAFAIGLAKRSPYKRAFDSGLAIMAETGLVSRWQAINWPQRGPFSDCSHEQLREGDALSMKHFVSIYLVCGGLVAAGLALLLGQHAWRRARAPGRRRHGVHPGAGRLRFAIGAPHQPEVGPPA